LKGLEKKFDEQVEKLDSLMNRAWEELRLLYIFFWDL
jgi:hypothetical protein